MGTHIITMRQKSKQTKFSYVITALIFFVGALCLLAAIVGNLTPEFDLPTNLSLYLHIAWIPLLGLLVLLLTMSLIRYLQKTNINLESVERLRLLRKVQFFWIEGVLEPSLHDAPFIKLSLKRLPKTLSYESNTNKQRSEIDTQNKDYTKILEHAGGKLLILGGPGSGKTSLLLYLARDLLHLAQKSHLNKLPVVFNLSTWADKPMPIQFWLIEELHHRYDIPEKLGSMWLQTGQLQLLLDGLDEVPSTHFERCIDYINVFIRNYENDIVVCCRSLEYLRSNKRLNIEFAFEIEPFTLRQIDNYIAS